MATKELSDLRKAVRKTREVVRLLTEVAELATRSGDVKLRELARKNALKINLIDKE